MRRKLSQEQIIGILKEGESGISLSQLMRQHNISRSTYYKWKAKYSGMSISDAVKLKGLEQENLRLKRLVADLSLEVIVLKDLIAKKWVSLQTSAW